MKIQTVEIDLPANWASALINGDYSGLSDQDEIECNTWQKDNPHLSVINCADHSEIGLFDGLLCDVLKYHCHINYYRTTDTGIHYLIYPAHEKIEFLPWQKHKFSFTNSGYGAKIPTSKMLLVANVWRRVYCTIYSNSGTCWINLHGKKLIVN
jgi:hypothetical protein